MAVQEVALRKRQQIAKANRMMFLWIAGVSVVVGVAAVLSVFLAQKMLFNFKVYSEKSKTASILRENNQVVEELQQNVNKINTNTRLKDNMVAGEKQPLQVVLDALPAGANSSAFGASLQRVFLESEGVRVESLTVDPVQDIEVIGTDSSVQAALIELTEGDSEHRVQFSFEVSTSDRNKLKDLLVRIERSIRPITLTDVVTEFQGDRWVLRAEGHTYYQPARTIDLKDKAINP